MMNVGNPDNAFDVANIPNDGVGLARLEFIINQYIRIHPMALVQFEKVTDKKVRKEIEAITKGYENRTDFFVDKLAQGIAKIAAAFYPNDVIVRMSDFKSNEYANLIGGKYFEPVEENPMIGWRGASRYYDDKYRDGFALECKAMKKVRNEMGLTNVKLMIPFCRTVEEGKRVIEVMRDNGIVQGENGLEIYMMVEIPSNVILVEEFAKIFDGFSIGSNDLTQLTLGLDRDSRPGGPHLRRAQPGRADPGPGRHHEGQEDGQEDRHLRAGAERLSRVRQVPGRMRHRQHVAQRGYRDQDDARHHRDGEESGQVIRTRLAKG